MSLEKMSFVRLAKTASLALSVLALAAGPSLAQKQESKEAAAFRAQLDKVRTSITKTKEQLQATLASYNDMIDENNEKLAPSHKQLIQQIDKSEKMVADIRKQKDPLTKSGDSFFASWEAGLEGLTIESLRGASEKRLQAARGAYQGMLQGLSAAGEAYEPFITSLKEQATLMGQDLTPETLALLRQDAAPELNSGGEKLFARIDDILNGNQAQEEQVDEALDAEVAADESVLDEDE